MLNRYNRWRERYNPLRQLTISRAATLLESYQRGEMADPQWAYFFIEGSDPDLFAILERREAALLELDWNIKTTSGHSHRTSADNTGFDATLAAEQAAALQEAYEGVDNLYEAFSHLQLATFRGYAHCEKYRNADGDIFHLELVDQWNMVRDLLRGRWKYNPAAIQTTFYNLPAEMLVDPADFIIRERDRHVNRIALLKFIRANLCEKDWDAFIEIYGIPSGVIIGPPGVQPGKEDEYQAAAHEIAQGGSGYLPHQSSYIPNEQPHGESPFKLRLEYLSEKLILAGTGGLLTMLAQSGSGTLAGGAHMEAFQSIARAEARKISELFQRQFDAEVLERKFPGQPRLAYFELAAHEESDPAAVADQALKLHQAGYRIDIAQLSEKTGYLLRDAEDLTAKDAKSAKDMPETYDLPA
jgi:phage gp29-like protein